MLVFRICDTKDCISCIDSYSLYSSGIDAKELYIIHQYSLLICVLLSKICTYKLRKK